MMVECGDDILRDPKLVLCILIGMNRRSTCIFIWAPSSMTHNVKESFSLPLIELIILAKLSITLSSTTLFHYHGSHHVQLMEMSLTPITFSMGTKNLLLHETLLITNTLYRLSILHGHRYSPIVGILLIISTHLSTSNPYYYILGSALYPSIITLSPFTLGRWHHYPSTKLICVWCQ